MICLGVDLLKLTLIHTGEVDREVDGEKYSTCRWPANLWLLAPLLMPAFCDISGLGVQRLGGCVDRWMQPPL